MKSFFARSKAARCPSRTPSRFSTLSTAKLYDETNIVTMLDPEPHLRTPEGTCVPLRRVGRYYMLEACVGPLPDDIVWNIRAAASEPRLS